MFTGCDKKTAIFAATLKLVAEYGFHGTSMSKVAKEANISPGTIYHYFQNKDDLILELFKACKKRILGEAQQSIDFSLPLVEQVRALSAVIARANLHYIDEVLFMQQFSASPYNTLELCEEIHDEYAKIIKVIIQAKEEKIIKDIPNQIVSSLFVDFVGCLGQRHLRGEFELTPELEDKIVQLIWDAIKL